MPQPRNSGGAEVRDLVTVAMKVLIRRLRRKTISDRNGENSNEFDQDMAACLIHAE